MTSLRLTRNLFQKKTTPKSEIELPAWLGDLDGVVKADDFSNVYVTLYNGQTVTAKNHKVPNIPRLPVLIGQDAANPNTFVVLRMQNAYDNPPYLDIPDHAAKNHSEYGVDPVYVTNGQILAGLAFPIAGTLTVQFFGKVYYLNGWHVIDNQVVDLTSQVPVSAGANMVLVECDEDGVISFRAGATKAARELLTLEDIPLVSATRAPLFAVSVYYGQTQLRKKKSYTDVYDPRFTGVSTGGISTSILWGDILDKPAIFPPDTSYTDPLYVRKFFKFAPPTVTDDSDAGYLVDDLWHDASNRKYYLAHDVSVGAADWFDLSGSGSGGGALFEVEGALAVVDDATSPVLITVDTTISEWRMYLETLGTSGSTTLDIILRRVGDADVSILNDGVTDNRPVIAFDDTNFFTATPLITDFLAGDVLVLNIDTIAAGAADVVLVATSLAGSSGFNLVVTDGTTTVDHVGNVTINGGIVTDEGGGSITISNVIQSITTLQTRDNSIYYAGTDTTDGVEMTPLNLVFTPRKAGNKIILEWTINGEGHYNLVYNVYRNGTILPNSADGSNNQWSGIAIQPYDTDLNSTINNFTVKIIDEDSLDVESTYAVHLRSSGTGPNGFYLNRTVASAGGGEWETALSVGVATEINT